MLNRPWLLIAIVFVLGFALGRMGDSAPDRFHYSTQEEARAAAVGREGQWCDVQVRGGWLLVRC